MAFPPRIPQNRDRAQASAWLGVLLVSLLPAPAGAESPMERTPLAVYALVTPREQAPSGLIARVVLPAGVGCPPLETQQPTEQGPRWSARPMRERRAGATTRQAFGSLLVCEAPLPERALAARIAGRRLPAALPPRIDKLAIFGDTGCRLLGNAIQACNDPAAWPLAPVVRALARQRADVAIFLGDFFYRESACPSANNSQCGGSPAPLGGAPFTDSGWGWVADALVPMGPLLESLPLVVLRGNHELCGRGGNGYFLLFDPAFGTAERCAPTASGTAPVVYSPTTAVELPINGRRRLRLVNVDSANGNDEAIDAGILVRQRPLFEQAHRLAAGAPEAWLLTHRPVNAVMSSAFLPTPPGNATPWSSLTQTAASDGLLAPFQLRLSSHLHLVQAVQVPGQPGQIVLGNGGTELDPPAYPLPPYGPLATSTGQPVQPGWKPLPQATVLTTWLRFGGMIAEPTSRGWRFTMQDQNGEPFALCRLEGRQVSCP
ncbi:MAG: hypothetical protein ACK6BG_02175 [Cyanobacteriota bacterium]